MCSRRHNQFAILFAFITIVFVLGMATYSFAYAEHRSSISTYFPEPILIQDRVTGEYGIVNAHGEFIVPFSSVKLQLYKIRNEVFCVQRVDDKGSQAYALCNAYYMITDFNFTYLETTFIDEYLILAVNTDYQYGYIDIRGRWVIQPDWIYAEPFSEGLALVQTEHMFGYIDQSGAYVLQYTHDYVSSGESFSEGIAAIGYANGLWGYIDVLGEKITNGCYTECYSFSCGFARIFNGQNYYFINHYGDFLNKEAYRYASDFLYGYAIVSLDGIRYGILSTNGDLVFPMEANSIINITPDCYCWIQAEDSTLFRLYDLQTTSFICVEPYELPFEEGFVGNAEGFIVKKNNLYGYLSKKGTLLRPCQYKFLGMDDRGNLLELPDANDRYLFFTASISK